MRSAGFRAWVRAIPRASFAFAPSTSCPCARPPRARRGAADPAHPVAAEAEELHPLARELELGAAQGAGVAIEQFLGAVAGLDQFPLDQPGVGAQEVEVPGGRVAVDARGADEALRFPLLRGVKRSTFSGGFPEEPWPIRPR